MNNKSTMEHYCLPKMNALFENSSGIIATKNFDRAIIKGLLNFRIANKLNTADSSKYK